MNVEGTEAVTDRRVMAWHGRLRANRRSGEGSAPVEIAS